MRTLSNEATPLIVQETIIISLKDLKEEMYLNFTGILQAHTESMKDIKPSSKVSFELSVNGSCQHLLTAMYIGFNNPWLVTFSIQPDSHSIATESMLSELSRKACRKGPLC